MQKVKISKSVKSGRKTRVDTRLKKKKISKISNLKKIALSLGIGTPLLAALLGGGYLHHRTRSKPLAEETDEKVFAQKLSNQLARGKRSLHDPLDTPEKMAENDVVRTRADLESAGVEKFEEIRHFEYALSHFHLYYMHLQQYRTELNDWRIRSLIFNNIKSSFNSLLETTKTNTEFQAQVHYFGHQAIKEPDVAFQVCQQLEYGFSYIFRIRYGFFPSW